MCGKPYPLIIESNTINNAVKQKYSLLFLIGALVLLFGSLPLVYQYGVKQGAYLEETSNFPIPTDLEEQATLCLEEGPSKCESGLAVGLECQYSVIRNCCFLARAIMENDRLYLAHPYPYTEENFTVVPDIIIKHFKEQPGPYSIIAYSHDPEIPFLAKH